MKMMRETVVSTRTRAIPATTVITITTTATPIFTQQKPQIVVVSEAKMQTPLASVDGSTPSVGLAGSVLAVETDAENKNSLKRKGKITEFLLPN